MASRANPTLRAFAERLRARGTPAKVVTVAVMRKRLVLAWTLLRTSQPFAAPAGPRPRERPNDADPAGPRMPGMATTQPVGP